MATVKKEKPPLTEAQVLRLEKEFYKYAGDEEQSLEIESIGGVLYVFGSELATLRIFAKRRLSIPQKVGYSENLKKWYYCEG